MIFGGLQSSVLVFSQSLEQGAQTKAYLNKLRYYSVHVADRLNPATRILKYESIQVVIAVVSKYRSNVFNYLQRLSEAGEQIVIGVVEAQDPRIDEAVKQTQGVRWLIRPQSFSELGDALEEEIRNAPVKVPAMAAPAF